MNHNRVLPLIWAGCTVFLLALSAVLALSPGSTGKNDSTQTIHQASAVSLPTVQTAGSKTLGTIAGDVHFSFPSGVSVFSSTGRGYVVGANSEIALTTDNGATWTTITAGLPRRVIYPFDTASPLRSVRTLGINPMKPEQAFAATSRGLYRLENAGWVSMEASRPATNASFTALAISPHDGALAAGTSFSGLFESRDQGKTWKLISDTLRAVAHGAGYHEEARGLAWDPLQAGVLYAVFAKGEHLYRKNVRGAWETLPLPAGITEPRALWFHQFAPGTATAPAVWQLNVVADNGSWTLRDGVWVKTGSGSGGPAPLDAATLARRERASGINGIYVSANRANSKDLPELLQLVKSKGMNAIVVDCKDDFGDVTYDSALGRVRETGALSRRFKLDEMVATAHAAGVYVIARIVVFKDKNLYHHDNYRYALRDRRNGEPWRYMAPASDGGAAVQKEFWVDGFSPEVWEYNIAIARELQERGVDEIQFDYIRFPTDGPIQSITSRYQRSGMTSVDALESFLSQARSAISLPISCDLYGFNAMYLMDTWIGQDLEMYARYADVICPMFYPSHYPTAFMRSADTVAWARRIYLEGTRQARSIARDRALIRPYIQAFLIGAELRFDSATYTSYLETQIDAGFAAGGDGFLLWNASNRYYMVTNSLERFARPRAAGLEQAASP